MQRYHSEYDPADEDCGQCPVIPVDFRYGITGPGRIAAETLGFHGHGDAL